MAFEISISILKKVSEYINTKNDVALTDFLKEMHHADVAEILDELPFDHSVYIIKLLDSETTSEILMDVDEDVREKILAKLSAPYCLTYFSIS